MKCPSCHSPVAGEARFCSECGTNLARSPGSERKLVTALFCDVVGSTTLGERLDAEELDELLRDYHGLARARIEAHGGTVEKFIGDAVVGVFGVPVAHEDDPTRAVAAASEIVDEIRVSDLGIEVRIGVNTGDAFVRAGVDPAAEGLATGDVMNTAARLQAIAPPMAVAVGERTYVAAPTFEFERLEPVSLKGKAEAVPLWRLVGPADVDRRTLDLSPFVGRAVEVERLREAIVGANGTGTVVVLEGEPGIGKSRLTKEVRQALPRLRWLRGRSVETVEVSGFRPFAEQIRSWVGEEPVTWRALEQAAGRVAIPTDALPFLAMIGDIDPPADVARRLESLDADALRPSIMRSLRTWLDAVARSERVVLEFEDWHWADGASVQLLRHVLPLTSTRPVTVLVVTRPGASPTTEAIRTSLAQTPGASAVEISLGPLTDADADRLLDELGVGPQRLQAARSRAEGNPYFIRELSRFLTEGADAAEVLPDTVRGVVTARVDRLDPELRTLVRTSSAVGRTFSEDLIRQLAPDEDVEAGLSRLVRTALIDRAEPGTYRFAHALTRDAVYEAIPRSERRGLHGRIAIALGEDAATDSNLPAIAYHLAEAEEWDAAATALLAAGEGCARLASDEEALEMYRAAIRAHERLPTNRWSTLERARIDRQVAETLVRLGRHAEGAEQVIGALSSLGVRIPRSRRAARVAMAPRAVPRLLGPPKLPPEDAEPEPADLEIARELELLGWVAFFSDLDRYALTSMLLANRSSRAGVLEGVLAGTIHAGIAFAALGRKPLAYRYLARALEAADRVPRSVDVVRLQEGLALIPFGLGTSEETLALARRGMEMGDEFGDLRSWGSGGAIFAWTTLNRGDLDEGAELARQLATSGLEGGDPQVHGFGLTLLALAHLQRGEAPAAIERSSEAIDVLLGLPDYLTFTVAIGVLAMARLDVGDVAGARAAIEQGRAEVRARGIRGSLLSLLAEAETEASLLELAQSPSRGAVGAS
ncbi:MAG TPA: adenylate/guanylate cyclase domain-containing protein, partial [Actinomycetota bacterium]